ncbi:Integrin alpha-X, partial [Hondaea fermentalgiana]
CPEKKLDIVWVVDNSGSIDQNGAEGSDELDLLLLNVHEAYTFTNTNTRFAGFRFTNSIVGVSGTVSSANPFGSGSTGATGSPFFFNDAAATTENDWDDFAGSNDGNGFTNTPQALQAANYILGLSVADGGPRSDAIKVVVLLTDGNPNRYWGTECNEITEITDPGTNENNRGTEDVACTEYQALRLVNDLDAYLVVVRIGNNLDSNFLEYCLRQNEDPPNDQPLSIQQIQTNFANLQNAIDEIVQATCIDDAHRTPLEVTYNTQNAHCKAYDD